MRKTDLRAADVLSFRHLLVGALQDFLRHEGMDFEDAATGLGEILVALSQAREEGERLYPSVFLSDDLEGMLTALSSREHLPIGVGARTIPTLRQALKHCAPLGGADWSLYLVRRAERVEYGLFREDSFLLSGTAMSLLRERRGGPVRIIGAVQLGENVLELRGASGARRVVYLSGADSGTLPAIAMLGDIVDVATRDVPATLRAKVAVFLKRVLIEAMRRSHGALIAVVPTETDAARLFDDGIILARPVRLAELAARYDAERSEESRASLQGAAHILQGMLSVDGITVLASDATVVGYNAFLHYGPGASVPEARLGGARRRTFQALAEMVGTSLIGAFLRSQDGLAECRVAELC